MEKNLQNFVKIIGEPTRLRILNHLKKDCCVGELWESLNLPQNLTSHHLKILRDFKLINSDKRGLKVIYCLNKKELNKNLKLLNEYLK